MAAPEKIQTITARSKDGGPDPWEAARWAVVRQRADGCETRGGSSAATQRGVEERHTDLRAALGCGGAGVRAVARVEELELGRRQRAQHRLDLARLGARVAMAVQEQGRAPHLAEPAVEEVRLAAGAAREDAEPGAPSRRDDVAPAVAVVARQRGDDGVAEPLRRRLGGP